MGKEAALRDLIAESPKNVSLRKHGGLVVQRAVGEREHLAAFSTVDRTQDRTSSRGAIGESDEICHNEATYYDPLAAHLMHVMPAVASLSSYRGNHLGSTWTESNRRSAFVGNFAF